MASSSFTALPDDVLQRVLLGVALDDHLATAAACRAFRAVIRGPRFLRLRREYGFAERGIFLVGSRPNPPHRGPMEIHLAGNRGPMASMPEDLRTNGRGSTTDGGARLFVSTVSGSLSASAPPYQVLAVNGSSRRWSRFATLPLGQRLHCLEWHGGLLYVAGGVVDGVYVDTLHAFNETTGLWEDLPPMPHGCTLAASGVIGNQLFIAGGIGSGNEDLLALQIYDFTARTWRLGAPLPHALYGGYGIVVGDGKLYLVSSRLSEVQYMLMYDVQSNTWTEQSLPPLEGGNLMHAFAHNGRIVAVNTNCTAYHRGTGSDPDWHPFDLDVTSGVDHGAGSAFLGYAGSVILG